MRKTYDCRPVGMLLMRVIAASGALLVVTTLQVVAGDAEPTRPTWILKNKSSCEARHLHRIRRLAFSPKGEYLGVLGLYGFEVWALPDCKDIFHIPDTKKDVKSEVELNTLAFSPDGKYLVTGGRSTQKAGCPGEFSIWDLRAKRKVAFRNRHDEGLAFVGFDREGKTLITAGGCVIRSWSFSDLKELSVIRIPGGQFFGADYNPRIQRLACAVNDTVKVWDYVTGKIIVSIRPGDTVPMGPALSPDGKWVATDRIITRDSKRDINPVLVWKVSDGALKTVFPLHGKQVTRFTFHPSEQIIAYIESYDNIIRLGDYLTGEEITSFDLERPDELSAVWSLKFSPDGKVLAVDRDKRFVQFFELLKK